MGAGLSCHMPLLEASKGKRNLLDNSQSAIQGLVIDIFKRMEPISTKERKDFSFTGTSILSERAVAENF